MNPLPLPFDPMKTAFSSGGQRLPATTVSTSNNLKLMNGIFVLTTTTSYFNPVQRTTITTSISFPSGNQSYMDSLPRWKPNSRSDKIEEDILDRMTTPRKSSFKFTNHTTFKFVNYTTPLQNTKPNKKQTAKK